MRAAREERLDETYAASSTTPLTLCSSSIRIAHAEPELCPINIFM